MNDTLQKIYDDSLDNNEEKEFKREYYVNKKDYLYIYWDPKINNAYIYP